MQGISLRMARSDDAAAMTVMQRASWLAAYGQVLGADLLEQLDVTAHLQIWQSRLAEPGPRPMLLCLDEVVIGLLYWQPQQEAGQSSALIRAFTSIPTTGGKAMANGCGRRWRCRCAAPVAIASNCGCSMATT